MSCSKATMELVPVVVLVSVFFSLGLLITFYVRHGARSRIRGGGGASTTFLFGGGTAPFGVADDVIRRLPTSRYSGLKGSLECAVCLADFVGDELLRHLPKCGHAFHSHCVDAWLSAHATCPLCRASLVPGPAQDFNFTTVQMEMNTDIPNQEPELRSTEMRTTGLYPSTGRSLVQLGEIHEGLPDEVREEDIETHEEP